MVSQKKPENALFRHSRENGNPVFSISWQILDFRLRGDDDFLRVHHSFPKNGEGEKDSPPAPRGCRGKDENEGGMRGKSIERRGNAWINSR
jgi:hypothetical protein